MSSAKNGQLIKKNNRKVKRGPRTKWGDIHIREIKKAVAAFRKIHPMRETVGWDWITDKYPALSEFPSAKLASKWRLIRNNSRLSADSGIANDESDKETNDVVTTTNATVERNLVMTNLPMNEELIKLRAELLLMNEKLEIIQARKLIIERQRDIDKLLNESVETGVTHFDHISVDAQK